MTRTSSFFKSLFRINPIIVKEIRSRMRGPRAFITLTVILLLMGGLMYAMLQIILANSRYTTVLSPQIGQALFASLAFLELFMISAVTPAVTAGAISAEKEKQTYEMLMVTPLSPTSILWGKLISALSYVLLLLFAAVPLASVVFIFGGVAPYDMLKALMVLLVVAIAFGILGLFMSALFGRTGRATVASFITVVVLMVGPLFAAALIGVLRGGEPPRWVLAPSPISALSAAVAPSMGNSGGSVFFALGGIFNLGVAPISQNNIPRPLYHYTLPFYAVLSLILYLLSTRLVQPTRRWRIGWRKLAVGLGSLVLLVGLFVGGYFATASRYEWVRNPNVITATEVPVMAFPAGPMGVGQQKVIQAQPVNAAPLTATPEPSATPTPSPTPTGPTKTPVTQGGAAPVTTLDEASQVEIYSAVTRQLFTVDNTFSGGKPNWQVLYLLRTTDDGVGDPNAQKDAPVTLPQNIQDGVLNLLMFKESERLGKVVWIDSRDAAGIDPKTGLIMGGQGVLFTFGNIHPQKDGTVQVSASLYFASMGATGKTYILSKVDGAWKITGKTGTEWIS